MEPVNAKRFLNKLVVVTGASAGIGRAIAIAFAKEGAHIGLISRNEPRLHEAKKEIEKYGVKVATMPLDIADANGVDMAAEQLEKELGAIDIWVNNAMVSVFSPVMQMKAE